MALQDILDKISQETAVRLKELEKEFNEKKKKLEEASEKEEKRIEDDMHNRVEGNKQKIIEKAETLGEREAKNKLLAAKRQIIDEALNQAVTALAEDEEYEKILTAMFKQADIKDEDAVVIAARGKEEITKKAIQKSGKKFFLSEKSGDIKGGFIIKTDKIEIDLSFETVVKSQMREDLEIQLNKTLF